MMRKFLPALLIVWSTMAGRSVVAQEQRLLVDLKGQWKFELGDSARWAGTRFDDSGWGEIWVPSPWEEQGYPGYDGYAWYRKHFRVTPEMLSDDLILDLGTIDDVDEVYLNGQFLDFSGTFPPDYRSAYWALRKYPVPPLLLKPGGDNVIAVRVYDSELRGGIVKGRPGLYAREGQLQPDVTLPAEWKFTTGDNPEWKEASFDDGSWRTVRVPAHWECVGFKDYDGYGWYRVKFTVPPEIVGAQLVMLVGKVDDFDETYLNGERIGETGVMPGENPPKGQSGEYQKLRAYAIPRGKILAGENVLAVRVYDLYIHGGIYDGPLGLITRDHYLAYQKSKPKRANWLRDLLQALFH